MFLVWVKAVYLKLMGGKNNPRKWYFDTFLKTFKVSEKVSSVVAIVFQTDESTCYPDQ